MEQPATSVQFMEEIKTIRKDLSFLKEHMADKDSIMTEEDYEALLSYREEKKKGLLVSSALLKKSIGF